MRLFPILALFCLVSLALPQSSVFAKSYTIDPVTIDATLNTNGSMDVKEKRQYNFSGSYTFAYLYINTVPDQSKAPGRTDQYNFSQFSLCDEEICFRQLKPFEISDADVSKPEGTFYVRRTGNQYYVKWFYDKTDDSDTFTLQYRIDNAVTLHKDIAELYWQFIGDAWEIPQHHVRVNLTIPQNISPNDVQAWLHGPLDGIVAIPSDHLVTYTVGTLNPGTFLEGRVELPKSAFSSGAKGTFEYATIK